MRKLFISLVFYLYCGIALTQSISQDAEGFSTIVLPATNFSLNIAGNEAAFNTLYYLPRGGKPLTATQAGWLIGGEIKGQSKNGLAPIFSNGKVVSGAGAFFIFGRKWYSNNYCKVNKDPEFIKLKDDCNKVEIQIGKDRTIIRKVTQELFQVKKIDKKLHDSIHKYSINTNPKEIADNLFRHLDSLKKQIPKVKNIDSTAINKIKAIFTERYFIHLRESDKIRVSLNTWTALYKDSFHKIFLRGGVNGSEFRHDLGQDSITVESRFKKKHFTGWNAEFAYNIQFNNDHFLGFSYQYNKINNLTDLDELEFVLTTKDTTIRDGQFTSSTAVKAVSGLYKILDRHALNFDYVWVTPIKKVTDTVSNLFLAINPYIRHRMYDGKNKLKSNVVLGFALNAFNSEKQKIMGGISIQVNDLFGVHADDDSTISNRISVGLIAKYSFSGIAAEKSK